MFFDISPLEMIALVAIGIIIFGPERLPKLASDAARALRRFREFSQGAQNDLRRELGPEFSDLRLEDLNPKRFVRRHLLEDEEMDLGLSDFRLDDLTLTRAKDSGPPIAPGERPPFDTDAT